MNGSKTFCIRRVYMSSALLDKLRVKPIPKHKSKIAVGLHKNEAVELEPVKIQTLILDKRNKTNRDIGQIRKRLAKNHVVSNLIAPNSEIEHDLNKNDVEADKREKERETERETEKTDNVKDKPVIEKLIKETEQIRDAMGTDKDGEADEAEVKPKIIKRIIKRAKSVKLKKVEGNGNGNGNDFVEPAKVAKPKRKLRITEGPVALLRVGDEIIPDRLPKKTPDVLVRASSYYMNNREIFVNFISSLFRKYKDQIDSESANVSCDQRQTSEYAAMAHQNLVRDYLNIYTPYRGLLLYHGLGSGKTCTSIGIAEGLKTHKPVLILTPASLRANFYKELKKCGDPIFRRNQFWEFISTKGNQNLVDAISKALSLPVETIEKQGGAWLVNVKKPSNYTTLSVAQQRQLDEQLNSMIESKYQFVNYNGLRKSHIQTMTSGFTKNPFDNKVVVIEEAHNFVSRIANKITTKSSGSIAVRLYEYLMGAKNCKIILLTGTPIINYPNELGIMFNILRGYIKTFIFKLNVLSQRKVSETSLKKLLSTISSIDYIEYSASRTTLTITKNPFGFVNVDKKGKYEGVAVGERGDIEDDDFIRIVTSTLIKNDIEVAKGIQVKEFKSLPESLNDFKAYFIDEDGFSVKNINLFKRRILGLASYFRSAQEQLMPSYNKSVDFHVVKVPMSMFQFGIYEEARKQERKLEKRNAQKRLKKKGDNIYEDSVSTYRIFSRAFCNFVFPNQEIQRPLPIKGDDMQAVLEADVDEDLLDAKSIDEKLRNPDGIYGAEDKEAIIAEQKRLNAAEYERRIQEAIVKLKENGHRFLTPEALETYSPKFLAILNHLKSVENENIGCNLIYSQFRTLEGVGILKLVLEQNGFTHFKLKKSGSGGGIWSIDIPAGEFNKPMFALYTGTEEDEEKEIIRNIYNSEWNLVPRNIVQKLEQMGLTTNKLGETIKVLMITASGAEGIDLKNVRYVHIVEPYWHPVRIEQVIGRARRICSHASLPKELRSVEVLLYLMEFSEEQLSDEVSIELRMRDKSKLDNSTPFTTDQAIYEIATIKEDVNSQLLTAVKEASVDCVIHSKSGKKEGLKCFTFGRVTANKFASTPSISAEETDAVANVNVKKITWKAKNVTIDGIKYALREDTGELFDLESFKANNPVLVGNLEKQGRKYKATWI